MEFDKSYFHEEIRCDFLVTEERKKVWHAELQILEKFDEICKKYGLSYYADYGTLLGAVRHQGFIPWDDDIDVVMFRKDYAKFQEIAPLEISEPYFFQNTYNCPMLWAFSKIRDSRTTAIEVSGIPDFHQGIFIDIYPLDDVPDENSTDTSVLDIQRIFWLSIAYPKLIEEHLQQGAAFPIPSDLLADLLNLPIRDRFRQLEEFNLSQSGHSERVNVLPSELFHRTLSRKREWFTETAYLPFEYTSIPAPKDYTAALERIYGNYHEFIKYGSSHEGIFFDPDTPYTYYAEHPEKLPDRVKLNQNPGEY